MKRSSSELEFPITFTKQVTKKNKVFVDGKMRISDDSMFLKITDMYNQHVASAVLKGNPPKADLFSQQYSRAHEDGQGLIQGVFDNVIVHIDDPPEIVGLTCESRRVTVTTPEPQIAPFVSPVVAKSLAFVPIINPNDVMSLYGTNIGTSHVNDEKSQYCVKLLNILYKEIFDMCLNKNKSSEKYTVNLFPDSQWSLQVIDGKVILALPPSTKPPSEFIDVFGITVSNRECLFYPKWKGFDLRGRIEVEPLSVEAAELGSRVKTRTAIPSVKGYVGLHSSPLLIPAVKQFIASDQPCCLSSITSDAIPENSSEVPPFKNLSEEQETIVTTVSNLANSNSVVAVHGVFGSGKTGVLAACIVSLAKSGRVLLISATNVAVDTVLKRLVNEYNFESFTRLGVKERIDKAIAPFMSRPGKKSLVATTTKTALTDIDSTFDFLIVDEAGQATEISVAPVLMKTYPKLLVMFGDENQLSQPGTESVSPSLLSACKTEWKKNVHHMYLWTQYRCHKNIARICSDFFYEGRVVTGTNEQRGSIGDLPVVVRMSHESPSSRGSLTSQQNIAEIDIIFKYLKKHSSAFCGKTVAIVSFYSSQISLINEELKGKIWDFAVRADTVDSFQGGEADIVIISVVTSNATRSEPFIANPNRLNVAISRARQHLAFIAHSQVWETVPVYKKIVEYSELTSL